MRPVFRPDPRLPVHAVKTYAIVQPLATHWRPATCAEVDCQPHQFGWATTVIAESEDETTLLRAAAGAVDGHRRHYVKQAEPAGFVRYVFSPGQACFAAGRHQVPVGREPIHVVRGGDWRGNPRRELRRHVRGADWVEDFAEHQDRIATAIERG